MVLASARLINLLLAAVLTGNEFSGWVGFHPALHTLSMTTHIQAEQAITRRYGAIMPFLMTATIVSCVPVLSLIRDRRSVAFRCTLAGMLCYLTMLGVTFMGNMPINRRVLQVSPDDPPAAWLSLRARWDRWHMLRNVLNIAGLGLLITSILASESETTV